MNRLLKLFVPLLLVGFAAPAPRPASGPKAPGKRAETSKSVPSGIDAKTRSFRPVAGATIDISGLDGDERLRRTPVHRSPEVSALVAATLRRYADGTKSNSPLDKAVAQSLNKTRNGKAVAKRIIARIDGLSSTALGKAFAGASLERAVTSQQLAQAMSSAGGAFPGVGVTPFGVLPAEGVPAPSSLELSLAGVKATEVADADGIDELLAMTTLVRLDNQKKYVIDNVAAPASGTITNLAAGDVDALDRSVYTGPSTNALLATAVFEVDGADEVLREDYLAMVALAKPLAEQTATPADDAATRLGRYAFALDYTIALLAVSNPTQWPTGVLQKTSLTGSSTIASLWATPAAHTGAVAWKLSHVHDLPSGHYTLYFDVPSQPIVQPNVKVKVVRIESLDPENGGDELRVTTAIGDEDLTKTLPKNKDAHDLNWTVQRKVTANQILVLVGVHEFDTGPEYGTLFNGANMVPCGDPPGSQEYQPCPDSWAELDVDPTTPWGWADGVGAANLTVNIATGKITGSAVGNVGEQLTITGNEGHRAKLKVVITVD